MWLSPFIRTRPPCWMELAKRPLRGAGAQQSDSALLLKIECWVGEGPLLSNVSDNQQLNKLVTIIPLRLLFVMTAGSFSKRFGVEEGLDLENSNAELQALWVDDPFINDEHQVLWILPMMIKSLISRKKRVGQWVAERLVCKFRLIDFKLEFGFDKWWL